ncbi:MAG: DNA-3-methyladenine glycosylase 2 family protein [Chitinophagaceae bacterium]|nr:DNA-3-methyladenine glycosylase 2 family protein [Chitinophagaceae bacterium]
MAHRIHLSKDKKLKKLVEAQEEYQLIRKKNIHLHLCGSIISQQLSTKVAEVIYNRFLKLFNKKTPTPGDILNVPFDMLRSIGLSNAKANYVQNVCRFFTENKITDARLHKMSNEEFVAFITQIKGIGQWTAEMQLMFTLGREDVFSTGDLGIQQAMIRLYKLDGSNKKNLQLQMLEIAEKWKPYRTYACRYLWDWKDNEPSPKKKKSVKKN